jgi:hypothetical protein
MAGKRGTPDSAAPAASGAATSTARVVRSLQRSRFERRTLYLLIGAVLGIWLFVVFANALADASAANERLAREQGVNATLKARASAGAVEIETIGEQTFLEFLSRSYGMGEPDERPFALAPGAPAPPPMEPLGADDPTTAVTTPLEDWLELLVGS